MIRTWYIWDKVCHFHPAILACCRSAEAELFLRFWNIWRFMSFMLDNEWRYPICFFAIQLQNALVQLDSISPGLQNKQIIETETT